MRHSHPGSVSTDRLSPICFVAAEVTYLGLKLSLVKHEPEPLPDHSAPPASLKNPYTCSYHIIVLLGTHLQEMKIHIHTKNPPMDVHCGFICKPQINHSPELDSLLIFPWVIS